jgi:hypothetical protein
MNPRVAPSPEKAAKWESAQKTKVAWLNSFVKALARVSAAASAPPAAEGSVPR